MDTVWDRSGDSREKHSRRSPGCASMWSNYSTIASCTVGTVTTPSAAASTVITLRRPSRSVWFGRTSSHVRSKRRSHIVISSTSFPSSELQQQWLPSSLHRLGQFGDVPGYPEGSEVLFPGRRSPARASIRPSSTGSWVGRPSEPNRSCCPAATRTTSTSATSSSTPGTAATTRGRGSRSLTRPSPTRTSLSR